MIVFEPSPQSVFHSQNDERLERVEEATAGELVG